jgi:hypothetical protein
MSRTTSAASTASLGVPKCGDGLTAWYQWLRESVRAAAPAERGAVIDRRID